MKLLKSGLLAISVICSISSLMAEEARLMRFPTTNGKDVVFSYGGDLYTVPIGGGEARKLTSHVGYEMFPRFSPDGGNIAFTGQYDGNTEVFLIPANGGEPERLTYTSTNARDDIGDRMGPNNIVITWSPDGKNILYRNRINSGFDGKLYTVSPEGGMPEQLPLPEGGFSSYSPDGKKLAYNRVMREFRNWKYYRGGMADDIWIYDPEAKTVTNITENPAQDIIPMWIGDEIFFISDRDMTMNFFVYDTKTGKTEKVTNFTDYDVKFPSSNGNTIVFEKGGYLYTLDPKTRTTKQIPVSISSDNIYARHENKKVSDKVSAVSASPDGNRLAITARGEVFNVPAGKGVTKNISRSPGANERGAVWSPDGKNIAYISDKTGETELWIVPADDVTPKQLTKDNDTYIRRLYWSPDSKKILYTDRKNRVVEVNPVTGVKKELFNNPAGEIYNLSFSPDSQWITYTRSGDNNMDVVYVRNIVTGVEIPVTEKWYNSSSPVFSQDGKYLIFSSDRDFNPIYSETEWNHAYSNMGGVYIAMLSKDTPSPFIEKEDEGGEDKSKADKDEPVSVVIDADGLPGRIVKLPVGPGRYGSFYSDGKKVWYGTRRDTKVFNLETRKEDQFADASMQPLPGGKKALFRKGSEIYVAPMTGDKVRLEKPVSLNDMVAEIDYPAEWNQIFDETWRAYRDGFYLENMHGVDWDAIKEKYQVLVPYAKTRLDLNYIIGEMIAELALGHAYVNPGETVRPERSIMGLLGADISKDKKTGFFRIDHILPDGVYSEELKSPLAAPGLGVEEGDYIVSVNGMSTDTIDNIYKMLVGKAGVLTEIGVNSSPSIKGSKTIIIEPIADEYPLRHLEWVLGNIKKVEEATDGKVGYIYVPDMGPEGLNEFARYYYPQLDKEALIIDDRANGGGNISPMLIERLLRKPYRLTMRRGSDKTGTVPDGTHVGPKVLLINKYSASDGDLFPWSFKANELGPVIGTRTWGGIVGISGSLPYMDGTDVRVPFFTNYDAKTGDWIVENHGVDPDIYVDNDPILENEGIDQQLNKAIEIALQQIKTRKPLPGIPAPRTFKDLGL
ncbi:MAG: PD40 domain-containing protein [Muribaculaceae bacterium]|nr:PD40 domain-containing protein [Muribaculaceae bacterium]